MEAEKPFLDFVKDKRIVSIDELKGHEDIEPTYLDSLTAEIEADGILKKPIVADERTGVILDGHHRVAALRKLGCSKVPVCFVDYNSPKIIVQPGRAGETMSKDIVLKAGLSGVLLPPKSSRHMIRFSKEMRHISYIEKEVNVPLEYLK
ncbi:ParB N-terminal domain-containing protein [Candidatus Bathyarchaeota archaeon]|nr:ParB N-terminal domain-containing protein [Candidatus Bathyarchaeota archaeon]